MAQAIPSKPREYMVAFALSLVGAQFAVGLLEAFTYRSTAAGAYASEKGLRGSFIGGAFSGFHYWASACFLLVTMALLLEMVWNEGYRDRRRYFGALAMAVIAFVFQLSGNLLPMDRHGVQTAVVEASITNQAPMVGPTLHNLMLRGSDFSESTLKLWWTGHAYLLPLAAIAAAYFLVRDLKAPKAAFAIFPALALVLGIFLHAPLGDAATPFDYGQGEAFVSWYTWPLHGMMSLTDSINAKLGWVGSVAIPSLVFALLIGLPWLRAKLAPTAIRLGVLVVAVLFLSVGAWKGGPIAALTGNRDPAKVEMATTPVKRSTDPAVLALVKQGRDFFNSSSVGCTDCHGRNGIKGDGGPDVSQDYKIHPDAAWFVKFIRNPKSVNPSSTMPSFPDLKDDQLNAIATFLSQAP